MKATGKVFIILGFVLFGGVVVDGIVAHYQYQSQFASYWDLSDKSSTIAQKSEYLDKFVAALDGAGLYGTYNALWFKTPSNSFDQNMIALKSLQGRMHAIQNMDENSFQYQTAIEQITAQEQGQAQDMLDVLHSCWLKVHHYFLWNDFTVFAWFFGSILIFSLGIAMLAY